MTVRTRLTHRRSLALGVAVATLALLPVPPASGRGQEADRDTPHRDGAIAAKLFETDEQLNEARSALEFARTRLEGRIREEFQNDPEVIPLIDQIHDARDAFEHAREVARRADDPAVVSLARQARELEERWEVLWKEKHDEIRDRLDASGEGLRPSLVEGIARLETRVDRLSKRRDDLRAMVASLKVSQDRDDQPRKKGDEEKARERGERGEEQLEELKERLGKDLEPLAEAIRRSLSRSLDDLQGALKKEGMTAEDLRKALEKSRDDLHESLKPDGPLGKEMHEAAERSLRDLREAMDRALKEADRHRDEARTRMDEVREQHRKMMEQHRREMEERQAEMRRETERMRARERRARGESDRDRPESDDLDAARREIRELRERLRQANERLERLRRPEPGDHERRLRGLEEKMDRLLKELDGLKDRDRPKED